VIRATQLNRKLKCQVHAHAQSLQLRSNAKGSHKSNRISSGLSHLFSPMYLSIYYSWIQLLRDFSLPLCHPLFYMFPTSSFSCGLQSLALVFHVYSFVFVAAFGRWMKCVSVSITVPPQTSFNNFSPHLLWSTQSEIVKSWLLIFVCIFLWLSLYKCFTHLNCLIFCKDKLQIYKTFLHVFFLTCIEYLLNTFFSVHF